MIFFSRSFIRFFLHLVALVLFVTSLLSGMRLAFDNPYMPAWLLNLPFIPQGNVHLWHEISAFFWVILVTYTLYVWFKNLSDKENPSNRKNFFIKLVYLIVLSQCLTGLLLLLNQTSFSIAGLTPILLFCHYFLAFVFLLIVVAHLLDQIIIKPWRAVYNMFLPKNFNLRSLYILSILGIVGFFTYFTFHHLHTELKAQHITLKQRITIDGNFSEPAWHNTETVTVMSSQGIDYFSTIPIEIKVLHNGLSAYFAIKWPDKEPSYTHVPLIKTTQGWKVKNGGFAVDDEKTYYEDKLAIMLSQDPGLAGGYSIHLGKKPLAGHPESRSNRGYHYTTDGSIRDVWHWKAVRGSDMSYLDDNHFGSPSPPCVACPRYKAGYRTDPKELGSLRNNWTWFYQDKVTPLRLPKTASLKQQVMENTYTLPSISWYDTMPYSAQADNYPIGTEMPSVLDYEGFEGDRANVRARGLWKDGYWYVEMSRDLEISSEYDLALGDNIYLWFAVFDHSQSRHSYHLKPVKLVLLKPITAETAQ